MMKMNRTALHILLGICLMLFASPSSMAQSGDMDHQHHHDAHGAATLSLDNGKKWATDEPLRQAMLGINHAAMSAVGAFHDNRLSKAEGEKLAAYIHQQVTYMVANCNLSPKADAGLHVLIGDLLQAAETLKTRPQSMEGLPRILQTLNRYADYFDHPDWVLDHP